MSNAILEEYRTLREELLLNITLERQILTISSTIYFAILAFLCKFGNNISVGMWSIILLLVITPHFLLYRAVLFKIGNIASYIEKFIESEVKELRWTQAYIEAIPKFGKRVFGKWSFNLSKHQVIGIYYLIFLFISCFVPPYFTGKIFSPSAMCIIGILSLINIVNFIMLMRYRSFRQKWEKIWDLSYKMLKNKS